MSDKKIIAYEICSGRDGYVTKIFQERIKLGWQPFGGISITYDPDRDDFVFAQAMVKYEQYKDN